MRRAVTATQHRARGGCAVVIVITSLLTTGAAQPSSIPLPVLTNIAAVRQLTPDEAARRWPVRVRCVVSYNDVTRMLFVRDETAGIYCNPTGSRLLPGDLLEITAVTDRGLYSPLLSQVRYRLLGRGTLPTPHFTDVQELASGRFDSQWVEIAGVVRTLQTNDLYALLTLAAAGGRIEVRLPLQFVPRLPFHLIDARVRIQGVNTSRLNDKCQLTGVQLYAQSLENIQVEVPAPAQPFAIPLRRVEELLRFDPQSNPGQRVRVRGHVTAQQNGRIIFVRDESQSVLVETAQAGTVTLGERVEVLGFPMPGVHKPRLEDAVVRSLNETHRLEVRTAELRPERLPSLDSELIRVQATVLDTIRSEMRTVLLCQSGTMVFNAELEGKSADLESASRLQNALVELTGICVVQGADERDAKSLLLLLRSAEDVRVLQYPPWWTPRRLLLLLGACTLLFGGVLAAIVTRARHKLRDERAKQAAAKAEFNAVLAERTRLAREIHDTLEQGLTGVALQLDTAMARLEHDPGAARRYLQTARKMVQYSRSDVRNSVWDLRSPMLEENDLVEAFSELARQLCTARTQVVFAVEGLPRRLPLEVENQLLRIGQEAVTNALKHAHASRVKVSLSFDSDTAQMRVADDGCGFDTACVDGLANHFGLRGMRERAERIQGEFQIQSANGTGTVVAVNVGAVSPARAAHLESVSA
jgi:signal transduction histidine kinase